MDQREIRNIRLDFSEVREKIDPLAILLFGSQAIDETSSKSDIDICVVIGNEHFDHEKTLSNIWKKVGGKYDVWLFEELPIKIQAEIIKNYKVIYCNDEPSLGEYFRPYWKKADDYYYRLKVAYGKIWII